MSAQAQAPHAPAEGPQTWGVLAEFDSPQSIYHAAEKTTEAGYSRVDSHTPFPIHGIDKALKQGPSHLGWFVIIGGFLGICTAQGLMYLTNAVDYEFWVSGKRPYAWPSTIPITFELMVLFSALTTVFGMFILNQIPRWNHPIFNHSRATKVSDNSFFLSIDARDPQFDRQKTVSFLEEIGGKNVEVLED